MPKTYEHKINKGWLELQMQQAQEEIRKWPDWMKRALERRRAEEKNK